MLLPSAVVGPLWLALSLWPSGSPESISRLQTQLWRERAKSPGVRARYGSGDDDL